MTLPAGPRPIKRHFYSEVKLRGLKIHNAAGLVSVAPSDSGIKVIPNYEGEAIEGTLITP